MRIGPLALLAVAAGCGATATTQSTVTLRPACGPRELWDGARCRSTDAADKALAQSTQAIAEQRLDDAKVALDAAEKAGPLDHKDNVALWEQRGIAAAYADDEATAKLAFDMLLALDPTHFLSYALSPKATLVFEQVLQQSRTHSAPSVDVNWQRGQTVGAPIPLDVEVIADPKKFLARATLYVRTHGEAAWRSADLALRVPNRRIVNVVLPGIAAQKPVSLDLYLRAYDDKGNEVLEWADASRPRELPLRYDPPPPWYRTWWGVTTLVGGSAIVVSAIVFAVTQSPPDKIGGDVTVK